MAALRFMLVAALTFGAAPGVLAQSASGGVPPELGWSAWLSDQEGLCTRGLRLFTADTLAQQLDAGTTLVAAEAWVDQRAQRESQKIARCLTLFRESKPRVARTTNAGDFKIVPETVITDARRAEIDGVLAKLDGDVKAIAAKAKAQFRAQSGVYFAKNLRAPTYFSDAVAAYEFVIAKRRPFAQVCGKAPATPPATVTPAQVRNTPYGDHAECASVYWQFTLPFEASFDTAVSRLRAARKLDLYNCTGSAASVCFPGQSWGKLLEEAVQGLADGRPQSGPDEILYSQFSRGEPPLVSMFNRYIKMRAAYAPLFCGAGQTKDCIASSLVAQSRQIGNEADSAAIKRVVETFNAGSKEAQLAQLAFQQWANTVQQPKR